MPTIYVLLEYRHGDSNPGAGNLGSVPSPGHSCAIPLRERVCCGCRPEGVAPSGPVSARRIRATLQRGCSERGGQSPGDGCLMVVVGDPGVFGRTSPSRWRMGSCAGPRAMAGTAHPSVVQLQSPRLADGVRTAPHSPARQDRDHRPGRLCGVVRGHQGCNRDANGPRRVRHLPSRRGRAPSTARYISHSPGRSSWSGDDGCVLLLCARVLEEDHRGSGP
jgi:hypothetical protein